MHCQFALKDVESVLQEAKVAPLQYNRIVKHILKLGVKLATIADGRKRLQEIIRKMRKLRYSIATTPELP